MVTNVNTIQVKIVCQQNLRLLVKESYKMTLDMIKYFIMLGSNNNLNISTISWQVYKVVVLTWMQAL